MNEYYITENILANYGKLIEKAEGNPVKDYLSLFVNQRRPMAIDANGIASIDVLGTLANNMPILHTYTGNTDYADVRYEIKQAVEQGAKGILLNVNSGGGTVKGCQETAELIASCSLPIVAFCEGLACSAAYYLASGASLIFATPSCDCGNIGTLLVMVDDSELMEKFGVKTLVFKNEGAEYKSIGYGAMSESQSNFLQNRINQMGEDFKNHVIVNRDVNEECFKAGWYCGQQAIDLGLADYIGDSETAYNALVALI